MSEKHLHDACDRGRLIESGWLSLRMSVLPADAPDFQIQAMRSAFFAGAQHLFSSILATLDPGQEATEADLGRFESIDLELKKFVSEFCKEHGLRGIGKTDGS